MKITLPRAVPIAPPTRIPSVKPVVKPTGGPKVISAPKTPPAVAAHSMSDYSRRVLPKKPRPGVSY